MKTRFRYLLILLACAAGIYPVLAQTNNLSIAQASNQVVLAWPSTATNSVLQSTTNLFPPAWSAVSPPAVVVKGQYTVTNPITGAAQFYRLGPPATPVGVALIPAGAFTLGDTLDAENDAVPVSATVSAFYIDENLVSYSRWQAVYNWAATNGYGFDNPGSGQGTNYPVEMVNWYDAVKWSNARSQQAGFSPAYYTDTNFTHVYTNGDVAPYVKWAANGYRLPTEAEWEKAARGGLSGQRFPWGNAISQTNANYFGNTDYAFDIGPNGYNAVFTNGVVPFTSPVGYFAPNGYGLYDMAGNVEEWCWDWYGTPYAGGTDPRGPVSGSDRVLRGGSWDYSAYGARCADRSDNNTSDGYNNVGFRCVKGL